VPESIRDFVMQHPLFDAHEHVSSVPDYAKQEPHFTALLGYANADLVTARGPVGVGGRVLPAMDDPGYTSAFFKLWRRSRATGYCRATERACRDLLGLEFREENADAITKAYATFVGDDPRTSYCMVLQEKAGVVWGIKDSIHTPEATSDELYPEEFIRFNYRDDGLLCILSRDDVAEREAWWQRSIHGLDDLLDGLMQSISDCLATGKVTSFKIGVAYRRGLDFKDPTRHEAERAFNRLMGVDVDTTVQATSAAGLPSRQSRLSAEELRPLQDYITQRYIRRAADEDLPIQVHTGYLAGNTGVLNNINPMQLVPTLMRYPRVRFDLFHAGWPYQHEMGTIGKNFPNVWLNLCWAWTMNPATMERNLDAWLDGVPHCKIFGFGSDTHSPLMVYGYAVQAREGIARVLQRKIDRGDVDLTLAKDIARCILLENGVHFHGLG